MTTQNEAAERLLEQLLREYRMTDTDKRALVKDALAAEHRATVERLEAAIFEGTIEANPYLRRDKVQRLLREEAAR